MMEANWAVPDIEHAYCGNCARENDIAHNSDAFELTELLQQALDICLGYKAVIVRDRKI